MPPKANTAKNGSGVGATWVAGEGARSESPALSRANRLLRVCASVRLRRKEFFFLVFFFNDQWTEFLAEVLTA